MIKLWLLIYLVTHKFDELYFFSLHITIIDIILYFAISVYRFEIIEKLIPYKLIKIDGIINTLYGEFQDYREHDYDFLSYRIQ